MSVEAAKKQVLQGIKRMQDGKPADALKLFERAIALAPQLGDAYVAAADAAMRLGRRDYAEGRAREALKFQPFFDAYNILANNANFRGAFDEALALAEAAQRAAPFVHWGYMEAGKAKMGMRDFTAAERLLTQAAKMSQGNPEAVYTLSFVQLTLGKWAEGWVNHEARLALPTFGRAIPSSLHRVELWRGQPVQGKTVLLFWEQGYGDSIQMLRYVAAVKRMAGRVLLDVQVPLCSLAAGLGVELVNLATIDRALVDSIDYMTPLFTLARIVEERLQSPAPAYLTASSDALARWGERLSGLPRPLTAVQWRGTARLFYRAMDPATLINAVGSLGTVLSLQMDARPEELADVGRSVISLGPDIKDFDDTAAILSHADRIVCVDTAVAHLSGALGRPAHVLLAHNCDWRWGVSGRSTNWYQSLRLYRQEQAGDWSVPVEEVRAALSP